MALMLNFKSQMLWENIQKGDLSTVVNLLQNGDINLEERDEVTLNPVAPRTPKTLQSFGCSECSRVKFRFTVMCLGIWTPKNV